MNKKKILLVEDEALVAKLLARNLQLVGYEMLEPVPTGEAAISIAGKERPDVVLMDIRLAGEMDGLDAAQEIMARYDIPIVVVTGYSDAENMGRAQALGAAAYLTKPVTPEHIKPVLDTLFFENAPE